MYFFTIHVTVLFISLAFNLHLFFIKATPFPAFPHGGRSKIILSPVGEIRKGVLI